MASEYRYDTMTGAHVLIAPDRGNVPRGPDPRAGLPSLAPGRPCPFCPGHEAETETTVLQEPADGPWQVRVVPNKYPAARRCAGGVRGLAGDTRPGYGVHEVVVETREHDLELDRWSADRTARILPIYRERVRSLEAEPGIAQVYVFRNRGRLAGSSQPHPHGQILASAVVGPHSLARVAQARERSARGELDTTLDGELSRALDEGDRIVEAGDEVVVMCPFAPHGSYETWIVPRGARGSFSSCPDRTLGAVAEALPRTVGRVLAASGRSDYSLLWRGLPIDAPAYEAYWYLEVVPRTSRAVGFELTSGIDLVAVAPETAAARLRSVT